jgi:hypothetical protein
MKEDIDEDAVEIVNTRFSAVITAGDGSRGQFAVISHSRGDAQLGAK